jgi:hypothetical protein
MLQLELFSERILEFVRPAAARAATLVALTRRHWRHRPGGTGNPATLADPGRRPGRTQGSADSSLKITGTLNIMTLSRTDSNAASDSFSDTLVNNTIITVIRRWRHSCCQGQS